MTRKKLSLVFFIVGVALVVFAAIFMIFVFSSVETGGIIGGADAPTFSFLFFHKSGGVCFYLTLVGAVMILSAVVLKIFRKR